VHDSNAVIIITTIHVFILFVYFIVIELTLIEFKVVFFRGLKKE